MEDKRKKLFNDIIIVAASRGEILDFEKKYPNGYSDWKSVNFKDIDSVKKLCTKVNELKIFEPKITEEAFFKKFACDIFKTSSYCSAAQAPTPTPTPTPNNQQLTPTPTPTPQKPTPTPVKAVVIQKGDYNLKVAGSDAIIY